MAYIICVGHIFDWAVVWDGPSSYGWCYPISGGPGIYKIGSCENRKSRPEYNVSLGFCLKLLLEIPPLTLVDDELCNIKDEVDSKVFFFFWSVFMLSPNENKNKLTEIYWYIAVIFLEN